MNQCKICSVMIILCLAAKKRHRLLDVLTLFFFFREFPKIEFLAKM